MLSPLSFNAPQPHFLDDAMFASLGLTIPLDPRAPLIAFADDSANEGEGDAGNDDEGEVEDEPGEENDAGHEEEDEVEDDEAEDELDEADDADKDIEDDPEDEDDAGVDAAETAPATV